MFKGDGTVLFARQNMPWSHDCAMHPDIAQQTISIHTNPGQLGTRQKNKAKVIMKINKKLKYKQPGSNGRVYNHAFSVMLTGSFCAKTVCLDGNGTVDLNFIYNQIPPGVYELNAPKCYPFCCP